MYSYISWLQGDWDVSETGLAGLNGEFARAYGRQIAATPT